MKINRYFVYGLIDPRTKKPFYIGKGTGDRPNHHWSRKRCKNENPHKAHIIDSLVRQGLLPEIVIYRADLDEVTAYQEEEALIRQYGRFKYDEGGILTNVCPSLRPPSALGRRLSLVHKERIGNANRGRDFGFKGSGNPFFGRSHTEQTKAFLAEKARNQFLGKKRSDKECLALRASFTPDRRAFLSKNRAKYNRTDFMRSVTARTNVSKGRMKTKQRFESNLTQYSRAMQLIQAGVSSVSLIANETNLPYIIVWKMSKNPDYYNSILEELSDRGKEIKN